jgi:hypothetical protein
MQTTILKCLLLCVAAVTVAQEGTPESGKNAPRPCTQMENDRFEQIERQHLGEEESDTLRSWDALYSFYQRYGRCANVSVTEGYSESIARILVDHWETLPRLAQLSADDQGFAESVRVSETIAMSDIATIKDNALHHCPTGLAELCRELSREADSASVRGTQLQVTLHARRMFLEFVRTKFLILLIIGAILGGVWFFGAGRSDDDGKTRVQTSVFLRFMAGFAQLMTLGMFLV